MPTARRSRLLALLALVAVPAACRTVFRPPPPVDPEATFAAHRSGVELVIDRLGADRTGVLRPPGRVRLPGAPAFVLLSGGESVAWFWLDGPARVVARRERAGGGPPLAEVRPSWDDGAIRLTLLPQEGPALNTDTFAREGGGVGPARLSRNARLDIDLRGTFRATVRDAKGNPVGWLRVRTTRSGPVAAAYEGVLPPEYASEVAAAAAVALDAEISWIERQTVDVHRDI
jgi:hypothetical protein